MNTRSMEQIDSGPYPVREGEPDCSYYIRTGLCRFGSTCRFNTPPNRKLAIATARMKGEYPERIGQSECQYYLKTGTCKFGATCKFHHPRDKAGIAGRVALNVLGYPLRPNEIECAYYMRNGQCNLGALVNSTILSHLYIGLCTWFCCISSYSFSDSRSAVISVVKSFLHPQSTVAKPFKLCPTCYAAGYSFDFLLVHCTGASSVSLSSIGQLGSVLSSENQHPAAGNSQKDGASLQSEAGDAGTQFHSGSLPMGYYAFQRDNVFPERPGQPECQFYMKTGDCKFGAVCKFHHPRERLIPVPDCVLSPIGLPLRPGEPLCVFYSRYGICKFGPSCKFDHPMTVFAYNAGASCIN
ncbi:UNVERIFIED_CONTAM: Zinc finger CCCH domain-containing protein ZFN-like [Sesamum radiatum]|uniref:Zinc finger CCCH domain-containing protein ZFN-like n=1 Tax=Sesamum radiatum TaxID=300843 RepID=A0AAW2NEG1_SESRA